MKKLTLIKDLISGSTITDIFLLTSATQGQAKNGPYWRLELRDASGSISGKVWSPLSLEYTEMPVGEFVQISARVSSYRDKLELAVIGINFLSTKEKEELSLSDFVPSSPYNPATMMQELKDLCNKELQYKPWHDFVFGILTDEEIAKKILVFPAAKGMHHAYAGGLLEHTLSVCRICLMLSDHYPWLDRQLLVAGAVCHDLGKIWELTSGITIDYTDEGRLIGHISLVIERIKPFISSAKLDDALALHLNHLILSHHGTLEFGSPKLPSTPEAMMLHYADNIDAKMQQMRKALEPVGGEPGWSSYVPSLDRFFYQAEPTPQSTIRESQDESLDTSVAIHDSTEIATREAPFESSNASFASSFSSTTMSDASMTFVDSYDHVDFSSPEGQSSVFDSYTDCIPAEDSSYVNDELPSFSYEEMRFPYEKETSSSTQNKEVSPTEGHSDETPIDNVYGDGTTPQKKVTSIIPNKVEQAPSEYYSEVFQRDITSFDKKEIQSYERDDREPLRKKETSQKEVEVLTKNSDNLTPPSNLKHSTSADYASIEENLDPLELSHNPEFSESSLSLDNVLIEEKNIEETTEKTASKSKSMLQTLSLLDHCS